MFGFGRKKRREQASESSDQVRADDERNDFSAAAPFETPKGSSEPSPRGPVTAESVPSPATSGAQETPQPQPGKQPFRKQPPHGRADEQEARSSDALEPGAAGRLARAIAEHAAGGQDVQPGKRFLAGLRNGLARTREVLNADLGELITGRKEIDQDLLDELEILLLSADVGVPATTRIIDDLSYRVKLREVSDPAALLLVVRKHLAEILKRNTAPVRQPMTGRPQVVLMIGVNGVGKTTTIGKLARQLKDEGNSVMLAAGDTFRAAAVEQLQAWGERNEVPVIAQHAGADPASVIFDALQAASARGADVLIADTAGRLHTKSNLMEELRKIGRVLKKIDPDAPHEVMLVLDATTGQNALHQAAQFNEILPLTGITLTKLDGTAKGGILFAIAERLNVPFRFIGVGERIEDLRHFDADEFLDALLAP